MIQFNLLPAIKRDYVKAKRTKRLTILGASLVAGVSLLLLALLFASVQLQSKHSRDLTGDIKTESKKLTDTQDISSILTIQNQLNSLSALHESKPEAVRLFGYLDQTTPSNVTISTFNIDFALGTIDIKGTASTISEVNTYADTLKFTTYKAGENDQGPAFSEVVLGSISTDPTNKKVSYGLTFKFNPLIFSTTTDVSLTVPSQVTTRSQIDKPSAIFKSQGEN